MENIRPMYLFCVNQGLLFYSKAHPCHDLNVTVSPPETPATGNSGEVGAATSQRGERDLAIENTGMESAQPVPPGKAKPGPDALEMRGVWRHGQEGGEGASIDKEAPLGDEGIGESRRPMGCLATESFLSVTGRRGPMESWVGIERLSRGKGICEAINNEAAAIRGEGKGIGSNELATPQTQADHQRLSTSKGNIRGNGWAV